MKNNPIQRTISVGGASSTSSTPRLRRLGSALRRLQPSSSREDRPSTARNASIHDTESHEPSINEASSIHENSESNSRQLQTLVARMRSAPTGTNHVDHAYKEFSKIRETCAMLCFAILQEEVKHSRPSISAADSLPINQRSTSTESPRSGGLFDQRSSFSGQSLAEVVTGGGSRTGGHNSEAWLNPIRDWRSCLEGLTGTLKTSLADTFKTYQRDATPEMIEAIFSSRKYRKEAIHRMRNQNVAKIMSADPQFFPRYEIRFRNYEKVRQELIDIRKLLQSGESGISPGRVIEEHVISVAGDSILEFANLSPEATGNEPVLRFRVMSSMLADASPVFARMFLGHSNSYYIHSTEDITPQLPPPPVPYFCEDGSEVRLFRMPQLELNKLKSLETVLHAAHSHSDKVPEDIGFEEFVAIAESCWRYRSTLPLEPVVEQMWLPQWMHKGADDMPDGLLMISYTFGLRALFTRMSKSAILNLVDEKDLMSKPWPQKIKDKIWAVRCAKVDQLYASCTSIIQEYIRPPQREHAAQSQHISLNDLDGHLASHFQPTTMLTATPRCPKGSQWCDASNLGWMMLVYNEMGLLPYVLQPAVMTHMPKVQTPPRSLAQVMDMLRQAPSAPTPVHPGSVCDPIPSFRASVADIFNSVTGLTLYDISGKSHGWALSIHKIAEPQILHTAGLHRMAAHDDTHSVVTEFPEDVRYKILSELSTMQDLSSAARINRAFYETYKRHEVRFMRNILRAGNARQQSINDDPVESKVLKVESDMLKERGFGDGADVITLRSDDEDGVTSFSDTEDDDDNDDDGSIDGESISQDDYDLLTRDPPPPFRPQDSDPPPPIDGHKSSSDRSRSPEGSDGGPATPRQAPFIPQPQTATTPSQLNLIDGDDIYEAPMTDEEARRILWPDHLHKPPPASVTPLPPSEGIREKFLLGDISFTRGPEEKTVSIMGEKQLKSDHDKLVHMLKEQGGTVTNGNGHVEPSTRKK